MRTVYVAAAGLLAGSCGSLFAAEEAAETVIVTATRTAQSADATLASVTVITRADLERKQALSVQDALRGTPGLAIDNNGGLGKATSIHLRGTNSSHLLVLVDGIKISSATLGIAALQDLPVDQIERIEIVRGPLSSLYGSEALGGVIQIFTRKGQGPLTSNFSAGVGTYHTYKLTAGLNGAVGNHWFSANLGNLDTIGFNAVSDAVIGTTEPDADGYRNRSATLRAGHRFDNGTELEATALRAQGTNQYDNIYDGPPQSAGKFLQQVIGSKLLFAPAQAWHVTLNAARNWDESRNYVDDAYQNTFNTRRDTVSVQSDFTPTQNQVLSTGLDYQNDKVDSSTLYTETSRNNKGLFAQYQTTLSGHDIALSARRDDNQQFGGHNTGNLMWGVNLRDGMRMKASYGTAFKAPTFNDLYWPYNADTYFGTTYIVHGNAELAPEKSRSIELGLQHIKISQTVLELSVYETRIRDLINWSESATGANEFTTVPNNIERARIRGLEASTLTRITSWELRTNMTLLDPSIDSAGVKRGNLLPRRTRQILNIDLGTKFGAVDCGAAVHAEGRRYDDAENNKALAGFITVAVRAELPITPEWRLQGRVSNLFDRQYETARSYNQEGRNFFLTLRYQANPK